MQAARAMVWQDPWTSWAVVEVANRRKRLANGGIEPRGGFVLVGEQLRTARQGVHLTQVALAARVGYAPSSICRWEQGRNRVPERVWDQLLAEIERERLLWSGRERRLQA